MSAQATQRLVEHDRNEYARTSVPPAEHTSQLQEDSRSNSDQARAAILCQEALLHSRLGHLSHAFRLANQAIDSATSIPDLVAALIVAGCCTAALDDLASGEGYLQRAVDLSRQHCHLAGHCLALQHLASHVQLRRGHFSLALTTLAEAARLGVADQQPSILLQHAWIYQISAKRQRAYETLQVLEEQGYREQSIRAIALYVAGQLALDENDLPRARPLLDQAMSAAQATGHPMLLVSVCIALSRWHRLNGDQAAREWAEEAVASAKRLESHYLVGQALIARGQASGQIGDAIAADADLRHAFTTLDRLGATFEATLAALLLSGLYQQIRHPDTEQTWRIVSRRIMAGGYEFLLERERSIALPLLAAHLYSKDSDLCTATHKLLNDLMRVPAPSLQIVGLGDFVVHQGHHRIPSHAWEQRKGGELFRFLLLQPQYTACRDVIVEALWPGKSSAAADRLLQQATWALRHVLEPDLPDKFPSRYLAVADHQVRLHLPPGSTVDFVQFERAIASAFTTTRTDLEQISALYTGALFPLDRYADWSAGARERLADFSLRGLLYLARQYMEGQRFEQALDCCDRITANEHWNEEATKLAMLACRALGDRVGALRRYETLKHALRHDLHLTPRADLRELAESIRAKA